MLCIWLCGANGDGIREKDGKNVTIDFALKSNDANENTLAIAMQSQLKKVGIILNISQYENLGEVQKVEILIFIRPLGCLPQL